MIDITIRKRRLSKTQNHKEVKKFFSMEKAGAGVNIKFDGEEADFLLYAGLLFIIDYRTWCVRIVLKTPNKKKNLTVSEYRFCLVSPHKKFSCKSCEYAIGKQNIFPHKNVAVNI